jgi:hypothetical protein
MERIKLAPTQGHSAWGPAEVTFGLPQEQQQQGPVELNKSKSK